MSGTATVHLLGRAQTLRLDGNRVVAFDQRRPLFSLPTARVARVLVSGSATITGPAMTALLRVGASVSWISASGRPVGRAEAPGNSAVADRLRQLRSADDPDRCLEVSRFIVAAKIHNQRVLLVRRLRQAALVQSLAPRELQRLARLASTASSVPQLLGYEGAASRAYFAAFRSLLENPAFRRDRSSGEPVNAVINYASALLREHVVVAIEGAGLDPSLSFLHRPTLSRPTLAFDLMEEWRPPLVDALALTLARRREVTARSVARTGDGFRLDGDARRSIVRRFEERLEDTVTSGSGVKQSFRRHLASQVRSLTTWLRDGRPYEPFLWR